MRWLAIFLLAASTAFATTDSDANKIPVTTKSSDARSEFLQGQDLADRLLLQQSLAHFDKAIELDPAFASAELARANASNTAKDFFDHLNKAVSHAGDASDGEKLLIRANQAGAQGDTTKQQQYLEQLLVAYPGDERAQLNMCVFLFGQQEYSPAIEHCKKATEIAPTYSTPYNNLGYLYRQVEDYPSAEQAFKKYIELIPDDPNPYDSYAELLLKTGRFDDSIAQYRKALSLNPKFLNSQFGIASNLLYEGKADAAAHELEQMAANADSDGTRRLAYFGLAVVNTDRGRFADAIHSFNQEYAVAEKNNDKASMSADLQAMGNVYLAQKDYDAAAIAFERSLKMGDAADVSEAVKAAGRLQYKFDQAAVAIGKKDLRAAKKTAEEYRQGAESNNNLFQKQQAHELLGRIALAQKDYATAVSELQQANPQNPMNLWRLAQAYRAKGDSEKAQQFEKKAASFNPLLQLPYAAVRLQVKRKA